MHSPHRRLNAPRGAKQSLRSLWLIIRRIIDKSIFTLRGRSVRISDLFCIAIISVTSFFSIMLFTRHDTIVIKEVKVPEPIVAPPLPVEKWSYARILRDTAQYVDQDHLKVNVQGKVVEAKDLILKRMREELNKPQPSTKSISDLSNSIPEELDPEFGELQERDGEQFRVVSYYTCGKYDSRSQAEKVAGIYKKEKALSDVQIDVLNTGVKYVVNLYGVSDKEAIKEINSRYVVQCVEEENSYDVASLYGRDYATSRLTSTAVSRNSAASKTSSKATSNTPSTPVVNEKPATTPSTTATNKTAGTSKAATSSSKVTSTNKATTSKTTSTSKTNTSKTTKTPAKTTTPAKSPAKSTTAKTPTKSTPAKTPAKPATTKKTTSKKTTTNKNSNKTNTSKKP